MISIDGVAIDNKNSAFLRLGYVRLPISINQLFFGNIFGNKCRRRKIKYAPDEAKFAPPCEYFF